ncbi:hypothetical protein BWQ96_01606 [Gracilariopsis chorda]|uniref:G-patch domain-containing protein n=1 Tax=Gracilariopsis chorda TaxID=448386 RepID=A0A2V3J2Z9_9FLOR|nr:hypothetical protein BWQ96_01606 [Gracilariopsis chorda]|eukprot:PXF48754.1 hypothetical protein BWQ96_01606 [Gracilariopsis chorda]
MSLPLKNYEASESERPQALATLTDSRKLRKRHRSSSTTVTARTERWKHRQALRLKECQTEPTLSEDESDYLPQLPSLHRTKQNLARLKRLPRPSEVVYAIDEGSAPEAGLSPEKREAHHRRIKATALRMQYLDGSGNPRPVPAWSRANRGLKPYSAYLLPPVEDRDITLVRAPRELLSSYYRGTLLKVYKMGDPRPTDRKTPKDGSCVSDPLDSMVDFMYWASTSEDNILTANEEQDSTVNAETPKQSKHESPAIEQPKRGQNDHKQTSEMPTLGTAAEIEARRLEAKQMLAKVRCQFRKKDFVADIMKSAQQDDDSLTSESDTSSVGPFPPLECIEAPPGVNVLEDEEPSKPPETQKNDLMTLLHGDLNEVLGFKTSEQAKEDAVGRIEQKGGILNSRDVNERTGNGSTTGFVRDERKMDEPLCPFKRAREAAMMFCQAHNKRPRAQAFIEATTNNGGRKRRRTANEMNASKGRLSATAVKIMKKMGFKERLGAREDGRAVPLEATRTQGRSGLGAMPMQVVSRDNHLLSESEMAYDLKTVRYAWDPRRGSRAIAIDPGPVSKDKLHASLQVRADSKSQSMSGNGRSDRANAEVIDVDMEQVEATTAKGNPSSKTKLTQKELDPQDEMETEIEDNFVDNKRRAMIIDMDSIVKHSTKRRMKAFGDMWNRSECFQGRRANLNDVLAHVEHDFTDVEGIKMIMRKTDISITNEKVCELLKTLDECYERLGPVEPSNNFQIAEVREILPCGILHRGSQTRLKRELRELSIHGDEFICSLYKSNDTWPYLETWKDMFCQLGVSPRQGGIIVSQDSKTVSGEVAANVLGAYAVKCTALPLQGSKPSDKTVSENMSKAADRVIQYLRTSKPGYATRRRRVLFFSRQTSMWHAGAVEFENEKMVLIRYCGSERTEWAEKDALLGLCRADYRKLKNINFEGLLEPEDINLW